MMNDNINDNMPLLRLEGVSRSFIQGGQEMRVLKEISLEIRSGEFVAIIGQSGSGKTTLMNILGCLDRPSAGRYLVRGADAALLDADALSALRREVFGFVFQRYNLLPGSSARENVEMPAVYAGIAQAERQRRAAALLERLGLGQRLDYRPSQLSGGQQQRVSIARALMNGGQIILADEPTGALDSGSGREVLALLDELHRAGHTVLLITHDPGVAARAHRVITLQDGVVISDVRQEKAQPEARPDGVIISDDRQNGEAVLQEGYIGQVPLQKQSGQTEKSGLPLSAAIAMSLRSLKDNRFRTLLTLLGIIIGVASVVAMLALGNGAKAQVLSSIESMGSDLIMIRPQSGSSRSASGSVRLVDSDIEVLRRMPGVMGAVGETSGQVSVRYQESDYTTSYTATGVDKPVVGNWAVARGEFFNERDVASSAPVVVLGQTVVDNIFPSGQNPLGAYVLIQNVPFQVIGVMAVKGANPMGADQDDTLLVPATSARMRLMGRRHLASAIVRGDDGQDMQVLQANIQQTMLDLHGSADFRVFNTASIMEAANQSQDALTMLLGSVAAISLLVGGIGVMNIMLVSVIERTREIGIRMACGARQGDIMIQFLSEALLVCILGGLAGVALGFLVAFVAQQQGTAVLYSLPPVLLALGCSLATGLIFGFTPARKAARLDPVVALASE
ncbi:MAG: MacB family efflux pump subunit [Deltaproteobacteria bacterium]|jgi:macrolide transport system ATP-binding/permease protein|nr:MacB family efflux pump subunit [Deltaproteobacteria bacterium]